MGGFIMDKATKVLILICFILVGFLGFTTGMLIQSFKGVSIMQKEKDIPENETGSANQASTSEDNGGITAFPAGTLTHTGEASPICPFCGGQAYQYATGPQGDLWYYYYHCPDCGRNFAEYTENVFT